MTNECSSCSDALGGGLNPMSIARGRKSFFQTNVLSTSLKCNLPEKKDCSNSPLCINREGQKRKQINLREKGWRNKKQKSVEK